MQRKLLRKLFGIISPEEFIDAATKGDYKTVLEFLKTYRHDPNAVNVTVQGGTALLSAVIWDQLNIVNILLAELTVDANAPDKMGNRPLICAARNRRHSNIVVTLLAVPSIEINATDSYGNTALIEAARNGNRSSVIALLGKSGINVNAANNANETALICAANNGHLDIVIELLRLTDIDINAVDCLGETALMKATRRGYINIVSTLLDMPGIDVTLSNKYGHTALVEAQSLLWQQRQYLNYEGIVNLFAMRREKNSQPSGEEKLSSQQPLSIAERLNAIGYDGELPDGCTDIFSLGPINRPIAVSSGIIYDEGTLEEYFSRTEEDSVRCPITRRFIHKSELNNGPCTIVRNILEKFTACEEEKHAQRIAQQSQAVSSQPKTRKRMPEARLKLFDNSQHDSKSVPEVEGRARKRRRR